RRLVETYYAALGDLDIESLEACTEKTARDDSTYVINLSVITKTRLAYEGRNPLVQARDWLAGGAQALPDGAFLYGIVGLSMDEARPSADRASFVVDYSLWTMDRSGEAAAPEEIKRRDELTLVKGKKGWKIAAINREGA
ncbi:MAG: hypothetical protein Q8M76_06735, partial [Spirochaetaceae bacterium]|nr:hypothetical protein [Spirochaetaceae bacterium]